MVLTQEKYISKLNNKIKMRKGQVSYFLLTAFILLLSFGFVYYLNNDEKIKNQNFEVSETSFEPIKSYVDECIKQSAEEAILGTGLQGGYYSETSNVIVHSFFIIPKYSIGTMKLTPPLQKIEEQISLNFDDALTMCIDYFEAFKDKGYKISYEKPKSTARILNNDVIFETSFPLSVSHGQSTKSYNAFSLAVPSRYKTAYSIADKVSSQLSKTPSKLCISCLVDYGYLNDVNISVANFGENSILITLTDNKVKVGNENFVFNFAHSTGGSSA